jgi:MFS transporter, DHA1 family, multidrug resistance protein
MKTGAINGRSEAGLHPGFNTLPIDQPVTRRIIYCITFCLVFQSTGVSILFTVYARKIGAIGQGVEVFGIGAAAFSLAALVTAPYLGMLADRLGRRRLLLGSLAAHALAPLGYLLVPTGSTFIAARAVAGGLTAGLAPASISMVGDLTVQADRSRWIGFMTGWSALGFVIGPPLGGWIFDRRGLAAPFLVAAVVNALAFLIALWLIPDTAPANLKPMKSHPGAASGKTGLATQLSKYRIAIPRPYRTWVVLGMISFIPVFAWRFMEPQFHFYIYNTIGWASARFGLVMSGYAVLLMAAETILGSFSDRCGRKPILMIGLLVHSAQYIALIATDSSTWIALGITLSGLGEGLIMPALNAYFLDASPEQYRAQMIGIKEMMFSLGGLAGPAWVVLAIRYLQPVGIFIIAGSLILFSAFLVPLSSGWETNKVLGET